MIWCCLNRTMQINKYLKSKDLMSVIIIFILGMILLSGCAGDTTKNDTMNTFSGKESENGADNLSRNEKSDMSDIFVMDKGKREDFMLEGKATTDIPEGYIGIYSIDDLQQIQNGDAGNYILMTDLNMLGVSWKSKDFYGIFEGNYHEISNIESCLFNMLQGTVQNLGMKDVNVLVAALAKRMASGRINNCYVTGQVKGAGGLICFAYPERGFSITIENCYNAADIVNENGEPTRVTGGIVGEGGLNYISTNATGLSFYNCENYGDVTGSFTTGGIIGDISETLGMVGFHPESQINVNLSGCFNYGLVSGKETVGGIIGKMSKRNDSEEMKIAYAIRRCANYNDISVLGKYGIIGAICGEVHFTAKKGYNQMLSVDIADCLNTASVNRINEAGGEANEGGGVCGEIYLDYGTCKISHCLNIGNKQSVYNRRPQVNNATPIYECTDYFTQANMSISDMKDILVNLSGFDYPNVWGIDSFYCGFPHPYGNDEQKEVTAYYNKKRDEQVMDVLQGKDKLDIILLQHYTDMLASMSLGGYWPEDEERQTYCSYLTQYSETADNYYAMIDIDEDGKQDLLVNVNGYGVVVYNYDLEKNKIQKKDTCESLENFENLYSHAWQIQWDALKAENYSIYTGAYVNYYQSLIEKDNTSDIGVAYEKNAGTETKLMEDLSADFGIEFKEIEPDFYYEGYYQGEMVFSFSVEDGYSLSYQGKQVDGVTLFGLYLGMGEKEAVDTLLKYGFKQNYEHSYSTGDGIGNYFVYYNVENGVVTSVSVHGGNMYMG